MNILIVIVLISTQFPYIIISVIQRSSWTVDIERTRSIPRDEMFMAFRQMKERIKPYHLDADTNADTYTDTQQRRDVYNIQANERERLPERIKPFHLDADTSTDLDTNTDTKQTQIQLQIQIHMQTHCRDVYSIWQMKEIG